MDRNTIRDTVPQTLIEVHGDFAIVRWEFALAADRFYTVRDVRTGQDGRSWRQLRVARNQAKAAARHRAWGQSIALASLGWTQHGDPDNTCDDAGCGACFEATR